MTKFIDDKWMQDNRFNGVETIQGPVSQLLKQKQQVITLAHDSTVSEAIKLMNSKGISQIPVTHAGKLIGLVTVMEVLNFLACGEISPDSVVQDVMDRSVPTVEESTPASALQNILMNSSCAIVIDKNMKPQHILTKIDLVDWICRA